MGSLYKIGSGLRDAGKTLKKGHEEVFQTGISKVDDLYRGLTGQQSLKSQQTQREKQTKSTDLLLNFMKGDTRSGQPEGGRGAFEGTKKKSKPWTRPSGQPEGGRGAFEGVDPGYLGTFQGKPVFRDDPRLSGGKYDLDISGDLGVTPDELYGMFGRVPDRNQIVPTVEQYQQKMQYDKEVARAQEARSDPFRNIQPLSPDASLNERLNWAANLRNANAQAEMQSRQANIQSDWQSVLAEQQGKDRRFNMEHNLKVQQHVDSLKENMIEANFKNEQEANKMQMFYDGLGQTDAHKQLDIMLELQGGSYSDFMQKFMNNVVTEKIRAGAGVSDNADLIADVQEWIQEGQDVWALIHGKDEKKSSTAAEADKYMQGR